MVEDTGQPVKIKQEIPFTDFPLSEFEFFCIDNVMLLKSECLLDVPVCDRIRTKYYEYADDPT